jgi:hypothetical protein
VCSEGWLDGRATRRVRTQGLEHLRGSGRLALAPSGLVLLLLAALCVGVFGVGVAGTVVSARTVARAGGHARATTRLPLALAATASGMIGAQAHGLRVVRRDGVLAASGGGISSSFTRTGVRVTTADGAVRLSLVGVGYGRRVTAVKEVAPVAVGRSVSYRRGWLREWYRNGPSGLEQGFRLSRRPAGNESGQLTLAVGFGGPLLARHSGSGVVFASVDGRAVLRYGGLRVRDAAGRSLRAEIAVLGRRLMLRVWDRGAHYPLTVDPTIASNGPVELPAPGSLSSGAYYGSGVAVSADGNMALIGEPGADGGVGAVWVFTLANGTWTEQQKLTAPTTGFDPLAESGAGQFGFDVALSFDGSTALISAPDNVGAGGADGVGMAWVFTLDGGTWVDRYALVGDGQGNGSFGGSLALSADGTTALVGESGATGYVGAAWAFTLTSTGSSRRTELVGPTTGPGTEDGDAQFGDSVALNNSGGTAVIGGPYDNDGDGAAWAFELNGTTWSEPQKLTGTGGGGESGHGLFGWSVAISPYTRDFSYDTTLIGGIDDDNGVGAAWVFGISTFNPTTWGLQGPKLLAPTTGAGQEQGDAQFGTDVAFGYSSALGETALIGGPRNNGDVGAAWVFASPGATAWVEQQKLTAPTTPGADGFGDSVAASSNDTLISDPYDHDDAGSVWATPDAPAPACTPERSYNFFGLSSNYQNCSLVGLHQARTSVDGAGGLPDNGNDYCVPTSAMDWIVWLANFGYLNPTFGVGGPLPAHTDWTNPANFNFMTNHISLMGLLMGTSATSGTSNSGLVSGIESWLHLGEFGLPVNVNTYQSVKNYPANPNQMGVAAADGALVMVHIATYTYDQQGNKLLRTGGHMVAYQQGVTEASSSTATIHVMDPLDPAYADHVQLPYHADEWVLTPGANVFSGHGLWSISRGGVSIPGQFYDGYTEITPEQVYSIDARRMVVDTPFRFVASHRHPRAARRLRLRIGTGVLDFAVAPEGFAEPFLRADSNTIFQVNRLTGETTRYAEGPVGASHLIYGGPAETLFVAGRHELIALNRRGRTIASLRLAHPIDALAYDDHAGRLVALLGAAHRVEFLSRSLRVLGSVEMSASLLAGKGAIALAVGPNGRLFIHDDGQPMVATAAPTATGTTSTNFSADKPRFTTMRLHDAPGAVGLAVDDRGHLFVSSHGRLVELLANGEPAPHSYFTGMPAAGIVRLSGSFSNAAPSTSFQ